MTYNNSSSIVAIDPPMLIKSSLGHDQFTLQQFLEKQSLCDVIICNLATLDSDSLHKKIEEEKFTQVILIDSEHTEPKKLINTLARWPIFCILNSWADPSLESQAILAVEKSQDLKQNLALEKTVNEQYIELQKITERLEQLVASRQNELKLAKEKTQSALIRWNSLRQAAISVHHSETTQEMEKSLKTALASTLVLEDIKINLGEYLNTLTEEFKKTYSVSRSKLFSQKNDTLLGSIFFLRRKDQSFHKDEIDFFSKIAELVSLALTRIEKTNAVEEMKNLWFDTFNAVTDPVAIVNSRHELIQTNQAVENLSLRKDANLLCYQKLFGRETPCPNCYFGKNFKLENLKPVNRSYEVTSQKISYADSDQSHYVHQYRDVSEKIKMERKIIDSTKLAEMGTIGSSIAHELNNPLGGILSFVQLIKMELKNTDPIYDDICEMEKGVLRSRDIIQNLLNFSRDSGNEKPEKFDLREVLQKSVALIEMRTRYNGIDIRLQLPNHSLWFIGHFNLITQAIQNLLQDSAQILFEKKNINPQFLGLIEIQVEENPNTFVVKILDNGPDTETTPGLGIPLAQQIFHDQKVELEISSSGKNLRLAKITFQRPVF